MKPSCFASALIVVWALLPGRSSCGAPVSETEAVSLAEWWYAAEVNAATTALPAAEKQERIATKNKHDVSYVLGRDDWQPARKAGDQVAAYVLAFQPSGFVVVSGDDALQPVLVFNATGTFRWNDGPRKNYISYYLGRCVVAAVEQARSAAAGASVTHTNWIRMRELVKAGIARPTGLGGSSGNGGPRPAPEDSGIYVMLPTALWNQGNYYNNVCVANNGGIDVFTGCVATALAIEFRYFQWPPTGNGANSYTDQLTNASGTLKTFTESVNFSDQTYNWSDMPTNDLTADNGNVANLMYDCGVAVNMSYGISASGAWSYGQDPSPDMNNYFRYRGTYVINSESTSDITPGLTNCIRCGVPVVVGTADHCFVACGYRTAVAPYFYFNMGWGGGSDGWYDVTDVVPDGDNPLNGSLPYSVPDDYAYANAGAASNGNGDLQTPYNTFANGQSGVASGGVLWLKTGQYTVSAGLTLSKPMTINSYLGAATVGN